MKTAEFNTGAHPRILWIGAGVIGALDQPHCTIAHEQTLEAGLLRLQNTRFDCIVVRLATGAECELLIELLQRDPWTASLFVQLEENSVAAATLFAHNGAVRVYGPDVFFEEILGDAQTKANEFRQKRAAVGQQAWRNAMIGESDSMRRIGDLVARVAARKSTVLITGETGTGKEVIATALHAASDRANQPFLAVNCGALPEGLLESELFGHMRGAFTGAVQDRLGLFERANGGTVFLDEIGDMPVSLQAKLLRVLQEQKFQRLGGSGSVRVDVRVIAATNIDLERAIVEGGFREDLFYRLNVIPIRLPALRERVEDIPLLASHLIEKICRAEGMLLKTLTPPALSRLCRYNWPGNIRQLHNVIERALVAGSDDRHVYPGDIELPETSRRTPSPTPGLIVTEHGLDFERTVEAFERGILEQVMRQTSGNKTKAAELLQLGRTTLSAKLRALAEVA